MVNNCWCVARKHSLTENLETVLNIVDESTKEPIASPVSHVFEREEILHLPDHTLLIAKDDTLKIQ